MATFQSEGCDSHQFEGDLPSGNVYFAKISTEKGVQVLKLVVK
ncbi:MAG: T9SS type A sorting domain-containing protein [Bacteroidales bacterium]|nr:T9SS type A sorting domain-containing protein [Bacteroidales bacterium]